MLPLLKNYLYICIIKIINNYIMKFTEKQKLQIVESYNNGLSTRMVAEKFSTT